MTFDELVEEVLENMQGVPEAQRPQRGEVKRLLNLAMREISLRAGVPQAVIRVPSVGVISGPFDVPVRFHPEGSMRVELIEGELDSGAEAMRVGEVPILSHQQAMEFHPAYSRLEEYCGKPFLVYSAADDATGFTPVGVREAAYRFTVHAIPAPMVNGEDEPFSYLDHCEEPPIRRRGAMPGWHRVLAHHVSYELLQRVGSERWQAFYARYQQLEQELFASASPVSVYLPGFRSGGD